MIQPGTGVIDEIILRNYRQYSALTLLMGRSRRAAVGPINLQTFLQSPSPTRWVPRRKAALVLAVRAGLVSLSDACERYEISGAEFATWEAIFDVEGLAGLHLKRRARNTK